jgi:hypothetical protein
MGKLAAVANRIVDRGKLSVPGEGASLSDHGVVLEHGVVPEHGAVLTRRDVLGSRGRQVRGEFLAPEPVWPTSPLSR